MNDPTLADIVAEASKQMDCQCDPDLWEPEDDTGHTWVCQIHEVATAVHKQGHGEQSLAETVRMIGIQIGALFTNDHQPKGT